MSQPAQPATQLTLVIPGLIWPKQAMRDLTHDLATPGLSTLLGKGDHLHQSTPWLLDAFGLTCEPAAAPLRVLGAADQTIENASSQRWCCLDPVNLGFVERSIRVGDPEALKLSADEAVSLRQSLAPIFATLGDLVVTTPHQWHLRLHPDAPPLPEFSALPDFIGGRADQGLPTDRQWCQLLNVAQQCLHDHPVNVTREASGRPTVNSLWPWGGGTLPESVTTPHDFVVGDGLLLQGLASLCKLSLSPSHTTSLATLRVAQHKRPLIVLPSLTTLRRQGDGLRWREALAELDALWFAPLVTALRRGELSRVSFVFPDESGESDKLDQITLDLSRLSMWKFWRKPKPLTTLTD